MSESTARNLHPPDDRDATLFVNAGWEFGGQATAAAKTGDKGGAYQAAVSVMPGG